MRRLLVLCAALLAAAPAEAAVFIVNSTVDAVDATPGDGFCAVAGADCTLRAAVTETNALPGVDVIELPGGVYKLTLLGAGGLAVLDALEIRGAGPEQTVIEGQLDLPVGAGAVIAVEHEGAELTIKGVTITRGGDMGIRSSYGTTLSVVESAVIANGDPGSVYGFNGGIVSVGSKLETIDTTVTGNGAGIVVAWGSASLVRTSVVENEGPGILLLGVQEAELFNSTLSGNEGCAVRGLLDGQWIGNGPIDIIYSTVVGDCVLAVCGQVIDGYQCDDVSLQATILAGSIENDSSWWDWLQDLGHNLFTADFLAPLADNGGPTPTRALLPGSPAIDAIPAEACAWDGAPVAQDQRGVARPRGAGCDIGAFEVPEPSGGLMAVTSTIVLMATRRLQRRREGQRGAAGQGRPTCSSPSEWTSPWRQTWRGMGCRTRRGGTTAEESGRGMRRRRQSWCRT